VCPEKRGLRLCGYGIPDQGFYSIRIPAEKEVKKNEVLGIMHIINGQSSVESIERELRHLFREVPTWTIKKMGESESFMMTFPSEDIRYQVAKFKSFEFETANVKAKVIITEMSSEADGKLETVWVKAYKFPPFARKAEVIMEIAYLIGDPEEIDMTSLKPPGPMRIKLGVLDATKIRGETKVFFNGESHKIIWVVETNSSEHSVSAGWANRKIGRGKMRIKKRVNSRVIVNLEVSHNKKDKDLLHTTSTVKREVTQTANTTKKLM
jgi:hypothetical protein